MKTIRPGEIATELLRAGKQLNVSVSDGSAIVEIFYAAELVDSAAINAEPSVFGPYDSDVNVKISSIAGVVQYFISIASFVSFVKSVGNNTKTLRVATFGDSTAEVTAYTANYDMTTISTLFDGTVTDFSLIANKFNLQSQYPDAQLIGNGGIGGETVQQMLDRDGLSASATRKSVTDLIDSAPDLIIVRAGSINDLNVITQVNYRATIDALYLLHIELVDRLLSAGVPVIDEGFFGYSGVGYTDPVSTRQALIELNVRYAAYAGTQKRLYFLDTLNVLHDTAGSFLTQMALDGVHLSELGGIDLSIAEGKLVTQIFGNSRGNSYPGVNLVTDPMFLNRTTLSFGERANTVALGTVGTTRTNAEVINKEGKIWQFCTFTVDSGAGTGAIYVNIDSANIVAGKKYGVELDISIEAPDPVLFTSLSGSLTLAHATLGTFNTKIFVNSTIDTTLSSYRGKLVFLAVTFTIDGADLVSPSRFIFQVDAPTVGDVYTLGVANPRIVEQV